MTRIKNEDLPEQPVINKKDKALKLSCIIDNKINSLKEGINLAFSQQIQKLSELDNMNHLYRKQMKISYLPSYLIVQLVRFFWKEKDQVAGTEATKSKILRSVNFPKILDISDLCSQNLSKVIKRGKQYQKKLQAEQQKENKEKFQEYKQKLEEKGKIIQEDTKQLYKQFKLLQNQQRIKKHDQKLYRQHGLGIENGSFQLIGVITHQGRTANSGHYVGWVHQTGDLWTKYDDDDAQTVKLQNILELKGGGDWHMAYYLLYRKIEIV